jgi:hypothetical protein
VSLSAGQTPERHGIERAGLVGAGDIDNLLPALFGLGHFESNPCLLVQEGTSVTDGAGGKVSDDTNAGRG